MKKTCTWSKCSYTGWWNQHTWFWPTLRPLTYYRDCAVPYVRHFHTGYGTFYCDSMKYKVILYWITMKYAVSHMKMPHVQDCTISVSYASCREIIDLFPISFYKLFQSGTRVRALSAVFSHLCFCVCMTAVSSDVCKDIWGHCCHADTVSSDVCKDMNDMLMCIALLNLVQRAVWYVEVYQDTSPGIVNGWK